MPGSSACGTTLALGPGFAPRAVAEHEVGLILALTRKLPRAYNRVREGNFSLAGLVGFDLHGKTVGLIGTGKIGTVMARLVSGFGAKVIAFDPIPSAECQALGVKYVGLE